MASALHVACNPFGRESSASRDFRPADQCADLMRGLVSSWDFDRSLRDSYGSNDLSSVQTRSHVPGRVDNALQLNKGDYVSSSLSASDISAGITFSAWVNPQDTHVPATILSQWNSPASFSFNAYNAGNTNGLSNDETFIGAVFDGRYAYFPPSTRPGNVYHGRFLRYDTQAPFQEASSWVAYDASSTGGLNTVGYYGGAFDGRYIYFAPFYDNSAYHGRVLRLDTLGEFTSSTSWEVFDAGTTGGLQSKAYNGAVFDGRHVYFVSFTSTYGVFLRFDTTAPFKSASSWKAFNATTIPGLSNRSYMGGVFDGRYVHFIPEFGNGFALRYDTQASFTDTNSWNVFDARNIGGLSTIGYRGGTFDGRYVYWAPYRDAVGTYHGLAVRFDTQASFSNPSSWEVYDAGNTDGSTIGFTGAIHSGPYIYYIPYLNAKVLRYDTRLPFAHSGSWTAANAAGTDGVGVGGSGGAATDGRFVYTAARSVLRIDTAAEDASFALFANSYPQQGGLDASAVGGPRILLNTTDGVISASASTLSSGWHFIAGTFDGSALKLYVDGSLASSRSVSGTPVKSTADLMIGGMNNAGNFSGQIDELRHYNRALSATEISHLYQVADTGACKPSPLSLHRRVKKVLFSWIGNFFERFLHY